MKKILLAFIFAVACLGFTTVTSNVVPLETSNTITNVKSTVTTYSIKPTYCVKYIYQNAIILIGQSNCEGGTNLSVPTVYQQYQDAYIYNKQDTSLSYNYWFANQKNGVNNNFRSANLSYVGCDLAVGRLYDSITGKKIAIVKYGYGGSGMVDNGTPYANGLWQIDASNTNASNWQHFRIFVNNFLKPAIINSRKNGVKLNFIATNIMQGETDALDSYRANHWEYECKRLLTAIHDTLVRYDVISPNYKVVVSRIHNRFSPARPFQDTIRAAAVRVANYFNGYWLNTDPYGLYSDSIHITPQGHVTYGRDLVNLIKDN